MKKRKEIIYYGNDEEFYNNISSFYSNKKLKVRVKYIEEAEDLINEISSREIYSIIIDFTSYQDLISYRKLLKKIHIIRKSLFVNSIPIIGLFKDKNIIEKNRNLFSLGLTAPYIKGVDEVRLFHDIYSLSFEETISNIDYAKAKFTDTFTDVKFPLSLTQINNSYMKVETDFPTDLDKINLNISLDIDYLNKEFPIEDKSKSSFYNYIYQYHLEIPFIGPWDSPEDNDIFEDSFEQWINNNFNDNTYSGKILVYSKDILLDKLLSFSNKNYIDLKYVNNLESFQKICKDENFDAIFFNLDDSPQGQEKEYEHFSKIVGYLKNNPVVTFFNSKSSKSAIVKTLDYESIIVSKNKIDYQTISGSISLLSNKKKNLSEEDQFFSYKYGSIKKGGSINSRIKVNSLTERKIVFESESKLSSYSLFKIYEPLELYILIIPPENETKENEYIGLVLGGSESDYEKLRSFIYQAISTNLNSLSLPKKEEDKNSENNKIKKEEIEIEEATILSIEKNNINRTGYQGRTKL